MSEKVDNIHKRYMKTTLNIQKKFKYLYKHFLNYIHSMLQENIIDLYNKISSNHPFYRDIIALEGILYKHHNNNHTQLDILSCSLTPYSISTKQLQYLQKVQLIYQKLLSCVTQDKQFLNKVFKETAKSDNFVARMLQLVNQTFEDTQKQQLVVTVIRNDYLKSGTTGQYGLVEFNTIAVGLGSLTQRLTQVIYNLYNSPLFAREFDILQKQGYKFNKTTDLDNSFEVIYEAYKLLDSKGIMLIINENNEKNIFDQRAFGEFFLKKGIKNMMMSLKQAAKSVILNHDRKLFFNDEEISIVYFRSGFKPTQYTQEIWQLRRSIELSKSLKIPTLPYQLVNFKRAQLCFEKQEVLNKYLTPEQSSLLLGISTSACHFQQQGTLQKMRKVSMEDYVLKPNRQGGGNNIYGQKITELLDNIGAEQAKSYVLMKRVPKDVRKIVTVSKEKVQMIDSVSEFGQFGCILSRGNEVIENRVGGLLLRSKISKNAEGGVSSGNACLDTYILKQ